VESNFALGALLMSIVGALFDLKSGRIPNWLTGGALTAGLIVRAWFSGWHGLAAGALGALFGGAVLFVPFLAHGIGGGDVKLMAAAGAWVGARHALVLILATAIAGGLLAIVYMIAHSRVGDTLWRVARLIAIHAGGGGSHVDLDDSVPDSIRFPYALAIAAGASFVFVSSSLWR